MEMSLPHALLGLLNYRPATGYQLKKAFKESIYFFWNATLPQIYRTLKQMEKKGWLTAVVEHQEGKPSRKVYKLTDRGLNEFQRWLKEPIQVPQSRNPMMLKVFFGNQMDRNQLAHHIQKIEEYHHRLLRKYEEEVKPVIQHHASMAHAPQDARYWGLTLEFGQMHARMTIDWCDKSLRTLGKGMPLNPDKKR